MRSAQRHYTLAYALMKTPLATFQSWLDDAKRHGVHEPNAMALATVDADGRPAVRMVLLKHADEHGFVFYTNTESPKADDLRHLAYASLCFYWNPPGRQVRVSGKVEPVPAEDADAYFNSRPYLSRIGAWASKQSKPLDGYAELERAVASTMVKHPRGRMPRPPH
jgi:pyridoxamine 5'-phosphate oxidase